MEVILLWLFLSVAIGAWAGARGQNGFFGFVIAAVLSPLVGAIIVLATPDKRAEARHAQLIGALQDGRTLLDSRPCPRCAEQIKRAAKMCRFCQAEVEPMAEEQQPSPSLPGKEKGLDGAFTFVLILLLLAIAVIGGISQLGSSANATFTTISDSM